MDELAAAFAPHGDVLRSAYPWFYDRWHRGLLGEATGPADHARWRAEWTAWRPDVIHLNKQCLEDGLDLIAAAEPMPVRKVATIHITQSAHSLGARLGRLRDRRAKRALDATFLPLIAVSAARGDELRALLRPGARVEVIDNGVPPAAACPDRAALRAREGLASTGVAILAVGRLEAQKNPLRFLDEINRLRNDRPALTARWVGGGRLESAWLARRAELGLDDVVRFDDWRSDVAALLPAFDLFLHTADFEGLPLALLEAMNAGLPAIVSAGVRDQLPPHLREATVCLDDRAAVDALLDDAGERARLGAAGRAAVIRHHSVDTMAAAHERLYLSL
ncbi:MAG: glycosyltransferase family 4 protein [Verrucomicrobiota bacterium]